MSLLFLYGGRVSTEAFVRIRTSISSTSPREGGGQAVDHWVLPGSSVIGDFLQRRDSKDHVFPRATIRQRLQQNFQRYTCAGPSPAALGALGKI